MGNRQTPNSSRREFLKLSGLSALAVTTDLTLPFLQSSFADPLDDLTIPGKNGLRVLNNRPLNAETPPHLLDDVITPNDRHFVRNNGLVPEIDKTGWTLTVDGEVHNPLALTLEQLKRFKQYTYALQIECGGNGRAGYTPPAKGNQWTYGAIGCATYTGVRMKDVLQSAGLKSSAVYTGYYGGDPHLSGDPNKIPISRGTPISKAMDEHTLIVWEMNGQPLPALHGFPLRVVTPGWPGSTSIKWLKRIYVRDREHDGPKMTGYAYRVPRYPVSPGTHVPKEDMKIIESLPVKSLITFPKSRLNWNLKKSLLVRGHAWAGDRSVKAMHVSIDFGANWLAVSLAPPVNRFAWQNWNTAIDFPGKGYYEIWARATDSAGEMQPMVVPGWNPKGYLNNAMHRIAVNVT
ncbi:MAG: sulfite oxidase [Nitrospinae bacterium]|nr:sulfite oxidase [Nitrospinota bacterium]